MIRIINERFLVLIAVFAVAVICLSPRARSADLVEIGFKALGPGLKAGTVAPDFSFQDASGKWVSLSDFRGKKVFLFSWSSWCRCKYQLPAIEKFYRKHKSDKFEVIAVATDSQGFKWAQQYLDLADATFTALVDPNSELPLKYNTIATENAWLIDEAGVIRMNSIPFYVHEPAHYDKLVSLIKTDFKGAAAAPVQSPAERIKALEAGLSAGKTKLAGRLELAELYRQQGDLAKAESLLRETVKKRRTSPQANYRLGVVLFQQGRTEEAVAQWEKAYRFEPTSYIYMRNIQAFRDPEKFYSELAGEE